MPLLLTKESQQMDIGTIVTIVIVAIVILALAWIIIWGIVALVGLRVARKAAESFDHSPFGIDPDLTIRQQHERIKRWGRNS